MKKRIFLLLSSALLLSFLVACGNEAAKEPAKESENPTNEEEHQQSALTMEETKEIIDELVEDIYNVYIDAGEKYNLASNPLTEEIYESMSKDLKQLGTERQVETRMYEVAKDFCYAGCDATYFPSSTAYALRFELVDSSSEEVTIKYSVPEDEISGHSTETVTIKNEDGKWKLDSFDFSTRPLNLTREEAEKVLQLKGYSQYQFVKESEIQNPGAEPRKVYIFNVNGDTNEHVGIFADTGYNYTITEDSPVFSSAENKAAAQKDEFFQKLQGK